MTCSNLLSSKEALIRISSWASESPELKVVCESGDGPLVGTGRIAHIGDNRLEIHLIYDHAGSLVEPPVELAIFADEIKTAILSSVFDAPEEIRPRIAEPSDELLILSLSDGQIVILAKPTAVVLH